MVDGALESGQHCGVLLRLLNAVHGVKVLRLVLEYFALLKNLGGVLIAVGFVEFLLNFLILLGSGWVFLVLHLLVEVVHDQVLVFRNEEGQRRLLLLVLRVLNMNLLRLGVYCWLRVALDALHRGVVFGVVEVQLGNRLWLLELKRVLFGQFRQRRGVCGDSGDVGLDERLLRLRVGFLLVHHLLFQLRFDGYLERLSGELLLVVNAARNEK